MKSFSSKQDVLYNPDPSNFIISGDTLLISQMYYQTAPTTIELFYYPSGKSVIYAFTGNQKQVAKSEAKWWEMVRVGA